MGLEALDECSPTLLTSTHLLVLALTSHEQDV